MEADPFFTIKFCHFLPKRTEVQTKFLFCKFEWKVSSDSHLQTSNNVNEKLLKVNFVAEFFLIKTGEWSNVLLFQEHFQKFVGEHLLKVFPSAINQEFYV